MDELVARHGIRRALAVDDLRAAHAAGQPAIIVDIEGLDFLEGKLERLEESYQRGVRTMQLVHYTPNDIGDCQTGGAYCDEAAAPVAHCASRLEGTGPHAAC